MGKAVIPGPGATLPVSTSVVILLYYLALAWTPSPSTYNNLGIVLSGISETRRGPDGEQLDGTALARLFYTAGLQLDPKHPHLLTNLGSLLKDQGRIDQAIKSVCICTLIVCVLTITLSGCIRRPSSTNQTSTSH